MRKRSVELALKKASSHLGKGEVIQAREIYAYVLKLFPANTSAKAGLAEIQSRFAEPPQGLLNELANLLRTRRFAALSEQLPNYLQQYPNSIVMWNMKGSLSARFDQNIDEAVKAFEMVISLKPNDPSGHNNLANMLLKQGKFEAAVESYSRALELKPDDAQTYKNMGVALSRLGKLEQALDRYTRALDLKPNDAQTYNNQGVALKDLGRLDEALHSYSRALKLKSDYADAYYNQGNVLFGQGKVEEAGESYARALKLKPDAEGILGTVLCQKRFVCDWSDFDELNAESTKLGIDTFAGTVFYMLSFDDNPERQMRRAKALAQLKYKQKELPLPAKPRVRPQRLRIGYFSADFHDHAMLYLMAGLFREHDKSNFDIYAYGYGQTKSGEMRKRLQDDATVFTDVADLTDDDIVSLARQHALDIAIDLTGYTSTSRSELFAYRLAPVQVNYLGYPSTMGVEFIDYVVADKTIIPLSQRAHYAERVIYMPDTYMPNDDARVIAETATSRPDFGLPEDGFVFCCFNQNYKMSPREFDIWMRILGQVEGSVLWLMSSRPTAVQNLQREANRRGVDSERLIFADKLSNAEHLARHKHADLFIDTFNYNAHTTAADALWAGLPVVTKQGNQFAARVAASLLHSVGLSELVTDSADEYEELILELACNRTRLNAVKQKLNENRKTYPLFDTRRYTCNFELAMNTVFQRYLDGKRPANIDVARLIS